MRMTKAFDPRLQGLYAITQPNLHPALSTHALLADVRAAIEGGVRLLQYRNKAAPRAQQLAQASELAALCRAHQITFLINDDPQLAKNVDADGVHLGQQDTVVQQARDMLGADKIIGITCNNRFDTAIEAQRAGADYVAFGRFYPSCTKPDAPQASPDLLQRAQQELDLPVVAIGGITPQNAQSLLQAGAHMLAVVHGLFGQKDIRATARQYSRLLQSQANGPQKSQPEHDQIIISDSTMG